MAKAKNIEAYAKNKSDGVSEKRGSLDPVNLFEQQVMMFYL